VFLKPPPKDEDNDNKAWETRALPIFTDGAEFRISTFKLLKQDGSLYKGGSVDIGKEKLPRIYRAMVTTRIS